MKKTNWQNQQQTTPTPTKNYQVLAHYSFILKKKKNQRLVAMCQWQDR